MKKLFVLALLSVGTYSTYAQNQTNLDASASQTVNVLLSNVLDISFTNTGTNTGSTLDLEFTSINDYANGVESPAQEIRVRSNKQFKVDVKTNAATFTYTGNANPTPLFYVSDGLRLKVSANTTGGSIEAPFSPATFSTLREFDQLLLLNCNAGLDQKFSVIYKATPAFTMPAGTYSVDVVYTATQL